MDSKQLLLNLIKFNYVSAYMHYSVCTLVDAFIQVHFARFCTIYVLMHIIIIIIMTVLHYYRYRMEMSINRTDYHFIIYTGT